MKTLRSICLLPLALAFLTFTGCSGGGGGQPNPGNQPGGAAVINPDASDAVLYVRCKGQVLVRTANGQLTPQAGTDISVISGGVAIDNAVTDGNGVYHVKLRRGQHNAVRATRAGYVYEPAVVFANPRRGEVLQDIIAELPQGNPPPAAAQGTVRVRFSGQPVSSPLDVARLEVRDAITNRLRQSIVLAGRSSVTVTEQVDADLLITPTYGSGHPWTPASARVRVTAREQVLSFRWPEPIIRSSVPSPTPRPTLVPAPRPTPRPVLNRPVPRPTPATLQPIRYPVGQ